MSRKVGALSWTFSVLDWDDIAPTAKIHDTGDTAQILCRYPHSRVNNMKYLCKGETPFSCLQLIQTTAEERAVVKGRFYIRDNKRKKYFYVYINNPITAHSGTYWCGSDRKWHHAESTKIHLFVGEYTENISITHYCSLFILYLCTKCSKRIWSEQVCVGDTCTLPEYFNFLPILLYYLYLQLQLLVTLQIEIDHTAYDQFI